MTSGHFIYIPMILTVGLVIGFILGGRAARDAFDMEKKREIERAAAKEKREARRKAAAEADAQAEKKA
jgi:Na+/glutamate symporter